MRKIFILLLAAAPFIACPLMVNAQSHCERDRDCGPEERCVEIPNFGGFCEGMKK